MYCAALSMCAIFQGVLIVCALSLLRPNSRCLFRHYWILTLTEHRRHPPGTLMGLRRLSVPALHFPLRLDDDEGFRLFSLFCATTGVSSFVCVWAGPALIAYMSSSHRCQRFPFCSISRWWAAALFFDDNAQWISAPPSAGWPISFPSRPPSGTRGSGDRLVAAHRWNAHHRSRDQARRLHRSCLPRAAAGSRARTQNSLMSVPIMWRFMVDVRMYRCMYCIIFNTVVIVEIVDTLGRRDRDWAKDACKHTNCVEIDDGRHQMKYNMGLPPND